MVKWVEPLQELLWWETSRSIKSAWIQRRGNLWEVLMSLTKFLSRNAVWRSSGQRVVVHNPSQTLWRPYFLGGSSSEGGSVERSSLRLRPSTFLPYGLQSLAHSYSVHTVDGWNPAPVEVGSLSHYLQGLLHPRWCRISAINSRIQSFNLFISILFISFLHPDSSSLLKKQILYY